MPLARSANQTYLGVFDEISLNWIGVRSSGAKLEDWLFGLQDGRDWGPDMT